MAIKIIVLVFILHELIKLLNTEKMLAIASNYKETKEAGNTDEKKNVYFGLLGNPIFAISLFLELTLKLFAISILFSEYWIIGIALLIFPFTFRGKKTKSKKNYTTYSVITIVLLALIYFI